MTRRWPFVSALALVLANCFLCACSRAQDGRSFSGNWDDAKAREIAIRVASSWPSAGPVERRPYAILPFDRGGVSRKLLLVAVAPPGSTCHACAPVTGGVMFAARDGRWEVAYDQATVVSLGGNGQPPPARLQELSPGLPAVAFEMDSMAQGYETATLTLVGEVAGKLKEILSLDTAGSNESAGLPPNQTFRWQAAIEYLPAPNADYPEIRVRFSGTKDAGEGKPVQPYTSTTSYRFLDGAYKAS